MWTVLPKIHASEEPEQTHRTATSLQLKSRPPQNKTYDQQRSAKVVDSESYQRKNGACKQSNLNQNKYKSRPETRSNTRFMHVSHQNLSAGKIILQR